MSLKIVNNCQAKKGVCGLEEGVQSIVFLESGWWQWSRIDTVDKAEGEGIEN